MEIDEEVVENSKSQGGILHTIQIPSTFIQRFKRKEENDKLKKFITNVRLLFINIPLIEAIQEISGYTNFIKKFIYKKKLLKVTLLSHLWLSWYHKL